MAKAKTKRMTEAKYQQHARELVDTRAREHRQEAADVARACRWLDRAAELYGPRTVAAVMRRSYGAEESAVWLSYWRRWRVGDRRHLMPWGVVLDAWGAAYNVSFSIALRPRVAA